MATGLACSSDDCGYTTTTQVPDTTDLATKVQLLQMHTDAVHKEGGGAVQVKKQTIKMKPMDHPEFDGIAKNYARFKQRFEEMITSSFDSMAQLEFLEKALPKWVKERMSLIRKTPEKLWKQLMICSETLG